MRDLRGHDGLQLSDADDVLLAGLPRVGRASGKAILVGEHFVVHGAPALAVPVPVSVELRLAGAYSVGVPDRHGSPVGLAGLELMVNELGLGAVFSRVSISLDGDLPLGAGLGGSAALAAAFLRALAGPQGSMAGDAMALAAGIHRLERLAHGNPSGLDGMTVALQRPVWLPGCEAAGPELDELEERFGRAATAEVLDASRRWVSVHASGATDGESAPGFEMPLTVAIVPRHGTTKEAVARVAAWKDNHPSRFAELFAATGALAFAARSALEKQDWASLGAVLDAAHTPLVELGLVSPEQEALVQTLRAAGAHGAKMSGAGLGGAVIALGPGGLDFGPVLRQAGAVQVFTSTVAVSPAVSS